MPNGYDQDISRLRALVQFGPVSESKCNFKCRPKLAHFILLCGCVHHQQASTIYCIFPGFLLPRFRVGGACLGGSDKKSFHITRIGSRDEEEGGEYGARRGRSRALLAERGRERERKSDGGQRHYKARIRGCSQRLQEKSAETPPVSIVKIWTVTGDSDTTPSDSRER